MSKRKPVIKWEPWADPYKQDVSEDYSEYTRNKGIMLITAAGIVPVNGDAILSEKYDLYVGDTNFDITLQVAEIIENVEGVEIFKVFSRYRFWLGTGRCFNHDNVKFAIERKLKLYFKKRENTEKEQQKEGFLRVCNSIKEKYQNKEHWAVGMVNGGKIIISHGKESEQVQTEIGRFGAMLYLESSWGEKIYEEECE